MSKYTTEVRFICEHSAGLTESAGYSAIDEVIGKAIPNVFSFNFPIFDEAYRDILCRKILKHYYTREICEESVGLWKLRLDTRMNEIMPYFNKLYKSELLEFNPFYDTDLIRKANRDNESNGNEDYSSSKDSTGNSETNTTNSGTSTSTTNQTTEGEANGSSEGNTTGTNTNTITGNKTNANSERDLYSDTPQGALTNVEDETYLTNARKKTLSGTNTENTTSNDSSTGTSKETTTNKTTGKIDTSTKGETNGTGKSTTVNTGKDKFTSNQSHGATTTEEYLETVSGKQGNESYSKMLMEYRKTFLNIDMQVIDSLSDLFFGLW